MSLEISEGSIVALFGSNGAGKTTVARAITKILKAFDGELIKGFIEYKGVNTNNLNASDLVNLGISMVPEGRRVFEDLTVKENLITGAHTKKKGFKKNEEKILSYFPAIKNRLKQKAGFLSGGEQQMLAVGRALMSEPSLLILDEPSLGLAPMITQNIFEVIIKYVQNEKISVLLIEQNARLALANSNHGYVLENGRIVLEDTSEKIIDNEDIKEFYLGIIGETNKIKCYKDVKSYRKRKRWLLS